MNLPKEDNADKRHIVKVQERSMVIDPYCLSSYGEMAGTQLWSDDSNVPAIAMMCGVGVASRGCKAKLSLYNISSMPVTLGRLQHPSIIPRSSRLRLVHTISSTNVLGLTLALVPDELLNCALIQLIDSGIFALLYRLFDFILILTPCTNS
jgi:hypothetical protein